MLSIFQKILALFQNKNKESAKYNTQKNKQIQTNFEHDFKFNYLQKQGDSFYITGKSPFISQHILKPQTIEEVFDFAYRMAFSSEGHHRNHRSGGSKNRSSTEIFANTFQGKLAECAACNYFYKFDKDIKPDFSVESIGVWDSVDLNVLGNEIAIKSTKHFGQLLLLETKDWNQKGHYIPNIEQGTHKYDYLVLIRIKPSCEDLLKQERLLYSYPTREELYRLLSTQKWCYDYAGYITHEELKFIIQNKYILPKNSYLNGKTRMDADNYYIQAFDMHPLSNLKDLIRK